MNTIIELKDGAVTDIYTDQCCYSGGCETCGYGSDYCTELTITFDDNDTYTAERHKMYDYDENFSIGYFVKLFCANVDNFAEMTKEEFKHFIANKIKEDFERE
jgi:hypothetical protein